MNVNYLSTTGHKAEKLHSVNEKTAGIPPTGPNNIFGNSFDLQLSKKNNVADSSASPFSRPVKKPVMPERLDNILSAGNETEEFNLLTETLTENGGKIDNTPGKRNIVAFRNPNLPTENNKKGVYDDTTFVFWTEKDGTKKVKSFFSNTDPNGLFTDDRPGGDFGRIMAGKTYIYGFSYSNSLGNCLRPLDKLSIERFVPGENVYKPVKTSIDADRTFLFHDGLEFTSNTYSMGCQTFPRIYAPKAKTWDFEFKNFWESLNGDDLKNRQKQIFYTILQFPEEN